MKKLQDYIIPFSSLKEGLHEFTFDIRDSFFEHFENTEISGGNLKVIVSLHKSNTFMELGFSIFGTVKTTCDRCLDELIAEVNAKQTLYIRFGDEYSELKDNVIIIPRDENKIELQQYIYEYTVLNLPIKRVHPDDNNGNAVCNPEMIEILRKHSVRSKENHDPVWDQLKDMIN